MLRTAHEAGVDAEVALVESVEGWLARYRRFWEGSFERMDAYLAELQRGDAK